MEHNYEYRIENVYLRPLCHSDIEHLRGWRNDSSNTEYLNQIPYITEEMQENWYKKYLSDNEEITFAIVEDNTLHRIVGSLSLCNLRGDSIELGKVMVGDPAAHGMKVGANASKAAVVIAHEQLGKNIVFLHVFEQNIAAITAYRDAGFKEVEKRVDEKGRKELTMQISFNSMEEDDNNA